jgi:hypothetical protein
MSATAFRNGTRAGTNKARSIPGSLSSVSWSSWLMSCETLSVVAGSMTMSISAM